MRSKNIISAVVLAFFAFIGGGSFSDGELAVFGIFIAVLFFGSIIAYSIQSSNDREEQEKKDKENEEAERRNTNKYNEDLHKLSEEYGEHTLIIDICNVKEGYNEFPLSLKSISNNETEFTKQARTLFLEHYINRTRNVESAIIVYEPKSIIRIMGTMYNFKDIIGVSVSDNQKIVHGQTVSSTKTSTGSMVGRAVVGDLVAGQVGSIIGGSTAKKNTTFVQGDDSIVHDYTIHINVNDISNPIIHINTWNDGELTNKIVGLMNVIIERNK